MSVAGDLFVVELKGFVQSIEDKDDFYKNHITRQKKFLINGVYHTEDAIANIYRQILGFKEDMLA